MSSSAPLIRNLSSNSAMLAEGGTSAKRSEARTNSSLTSGNFKRESLVAMFNRALKTLPADVYDFIEISQMDPALIFTENIVNRLIIMLLNEQDPRISDKVKCNHFLNV